MFRYGICFVWNRAKSLGETYFGCFRTTMSVIKNSGFLYWTNFMRENQSSFISRRTCRFAYICLRRAAKEPRPYFTRMTAFSIKFNVRKKLCTSFTCVRIDYANNKVSSRHTHRACKKPFRYRQNRKWDDYFITMIGSKILRRYVHKPRTW